ncbi:MAG: NUDIX hydrolase [Pseudomonadota bacterium]
MESTWLTWAKRLQGLAATGQHYTESDYDMDRYREVDGIARQMIADLASVAPAALTALPVPEEGYATPKVDVRGAVFRAGRVLLVRERVDGLWTMPGGFAEIGLTASDNVVKEVREEAGIDVEVRKLIQLRHRAKMVGAPDYRDFYKLFFLCMPRDEMDPVPGPEVLDAAYFDPARLPDMSLGRSGPADVSRALAHVSRPDLPTDWD